MNSSKFHNSIITPLKEENLSSEIIKLLSQHPIPNPITLTLTARQRVDGERVDDIKLFQNFRHFLNLLNKELFGHASQRFGKKLKVWNVREVSGEGRYHLHCLIEKPTHISSDKLKELVVSIWSKKTQWGYDQIHIDYPNEDNGGEISWINYCLKRRSKITDIGSSVDWENINIH